MKTPKLILVLIFSICLFGCAFEEKQEAEKKLTSSIDNFHALFNEEKFNQIYTEADDELKNKFTEQQFVSYLEVVKNDVGEINKEPLVHINSGLQDEIKSIWSKRTDFSNSQLINTNKAFYNEDFKFTLKEGEAKIAFYEVNKICDKPCAIGIGRK